MCGNGIANRPVEECDDGNTNNDDKCTNQCHWNRDYKEPEEDPVPDDDCPEVQPCPECPECADYSAATSTGMLTGEDANQLLQQLLEAKAANDAQIAVNEAQALQILSL